MRSHAGAASAPHMPIRNDVVSSEAGPANPAETAAANATEIADRERLRDDQEPARVHDIGQRSGRQGQEKERQGGRDLDGGNQSRARIEAGHHPGRTRVEHRQSDARKRRRDRG